MAHKFNPILYEFALTPELADSVFCWNLKQFSVDMPSFAVLLDHTIGVIWHLFNDNGSQICNLNKADVGWALRFLEAIDVAHIADTSDFEMLKDFMRKILITRYSMEDEAEFLNQSLQRENEIPEPSTSLAIEEFYNSFEIERDLKQQAEKLPSKPVEDTEAVTTCNDEEILKKLQALNPQIQKLEDIVNMTMRPPSVRNSQRSSYEQIQPGVAASLSSVVPSPVKSIVPEV
jgi:hypothetical protein